MKKSVIIWLLVLINYVCIVAVVNAEDFPFEKTPIKINLNDFMKIENRLNINWNNLGEGVSYSVYLSANEKFEDCIPATQVFAETQAEIEVLSQYQQKFENIITDGGSVVSPSVDDWTLGSEFAPAVGIANSTATAGSTFGKDGTSWGVKLTAPANSNSALLERPSLTRTFTDTAVTSGVISYQFDFKLVGARGIDVICGHSAVGAFVLTPTTIYMYGRSGDTTILKTGLDLSSNWHMFRVDTLINDINSEYSKNDVYLDGVFIGSYLTRFSTTLDREIKQIKFVGTNGELSKANVEAYFDNINITYSNLIDTYEYIFIVAYKEQKVVARSAAYPINGRIVSGVIKLPYNEKAIHDLPIKISASNNLGIITTLEPNYYAEVDVVIPQGQNAINFVIPVVLKQSSNDYYIGFNLNSLNDNYVQNGFYTNDGTVANINYAKKVNVTYGNINNVELVIKSPLDYLDDTGNTIYSSTQVQLGQEINGVVDYTSDSDYFKFIPPATGEYIIQSFGNTDTFGYLINDKGHYITSDDDSGEDNNFLINYKLLGGVTYYIRVDSVLGKIGAYNISIIPSTGMVFISDARFFNAETGTQISELTELQKLRIEAAVKNTTNNSIDATIIAALYSSKGTIKSIKILEKHKVYSNSSSEFDITFDLPNNIDNNYLKIYIWNDGITLKPLSEVVTFFN